MKDGRYNMSLSADGYTGKGDLSLNDNRGQGHDGKFKVELHLQGQGPKLAGIANVLMSPHVVHNSRMPEHYSLSMTGTEAENSFSLIGIGPLGLIIEISAQRVNA